MKNDIFSPLLSKVILRYVVSFQPLFLKIFLNATYLGCSIPYQFSTDVESKLTKFLQLIGTFIQLIGTFLRQ
jgi:hypothetical protein